MDPTPFFCHIGKYVSGDGDNIILIWRLMMVFFRQQNSHKYVFAAMELLISIQSLLTEKEAAKVIWNWTTGKIFSLLILRILKICSTLLVKTTPNRNGEIKDMKITILNYFGIIF